MTTIILLFIKLILYVLKYLHSSMLFLFFLWHIIMIFGSSISALWMRHMCVRCLLQFLTTLQCKLSVSRKLIYRLDHCRYMHNWCCDIKKIDPRNTKCLCILSKYFVHFGLYLYQKIRKVDRMGILWQECLQRLCRKQSRRGWDCRVYNLSLQTKV